MGESLTAIALCGLGVTMVILSGSHVAVYHMCTLGLVCSDMGILQIGFFNGDELCLEANWDRAA